MARQLMSFDPYEGTLPKIWLNPRRVQSVTRHPRVVGVEGPLTSVTMFGGDEDETYCVAGDADDIAIKINVAAVEE